MVTPPPAAPGHPGAPSVPPPPGWGVTPPLFQAGPVSFYQAASHPTRLVAGEGLPDRTLLSYGNHYRPNETAFGLFYPAVASLGGVVLAVGSFQGLGLAAAAHASGLLVATEDPLIALTFALLLPRMGEEEPTGVENAAYNILHDGVPVEGLVEPIPEDFRPALSAHISFLRGRFGAHFARPLLEVFVDPIWRGLVSSEGYAHVQAMIRGGRVAILYGEILGDEMPDLVGAVLSVQTDPLRVVYLKNRVEDAVVKRRPVRTISLRSILSHPRTDPAGVVLSVVDFSQFKGRRPGQTELATPMHATPIAQAKKALSREDGFREFLVAAAREGTLTHT